MTAQEVLETVRYENTSALIRDSQIEHFYTSKVFGFYFFVLCALIMGFIIYSSIRELRKDLVRCDGPWRNE